MGWDDGCQNVNADSDASTAVSTEASLTSWNIVWCSERCYKAENDERRERLSELAQAAGATLVLLKKAHKFAVFSLVVCDDEEKAYERAKQWMEELPPRADPVHVVKEGGLNVLKKFLANLGEKSPTSDRSSTNVSFTDGDDDSSASTPRSSPQGTRNGLPLTSLFLAQGATFQQDSLLAPGPEVRCGDESILAIASEGAGMSFTSGIDEIHREESWLLSLQNSALLPEVFDLLSSVLQHQTPAEVAALLHAAQPDIYDD